MPGTRGQVSRFKHNNVVLATAFAPDAHLVATGGGNQNAIQLWRPEDGQPVRRLAGQGRLVWSVAFGRNGQSVVFGNKSSSRNPNHRGPLERTILLERDGHFDLALGGPVTDEAAFERARAEVAGFHLEIPSGDVHPRLRIVRQGRVVHEIERDRTSGHDHRSFTFSHDGRDVISGGAGGFLAVYNRATGEKLRDLVGHTGDVWAVAVSPDDRFVVSGSSDQTVRLWDLATGELLVSFFVGQDEEWVAWTPKGYYTASMRGDRYVGWHINRGVDQAAEYYPVHHFRRQYYRPDVVVKALELRDHELALREADRLRLMSTPAGPPEPPPSVFVFEPHTDGLTVTEPVLRVRVAAVSTSAAITELTVTLNGRVAILPFYLATGLDLRSIRILRFLRLFRAFKLARYSRAIQRFHRAFLIAREEVILFLIATAMLLYFAAVGIYYFENSTQPESFQSVFHSLTRRRGLGTQETLSPS